MGQAALYPGPRDLKKQVIKEVQLGLCSHTHTEGWGHRRDLQEQKDILLHCSLPKHRTAPTPAYRGCLTDAALLEKSSCTHTGCTCPASIANPGHPLQGRAERLAGRPLPAARQGTGGAKLFLSTQKDNILNNHSLRVLYAVGRSHSSWHLFCLHILTKSSKPHSKIATDKICCCPGLRKYFERTVSRVQMPSVMRHSSQSSLFPCICLLHYPKKD